MKRYILIGILLLGIVSNVYAYDPWAEQIVVDDKGGYYSTTNVESVLQEIGAKPFYAVTSAIINNWNAAYSWGNHADAGYLTSYTETDPVFSAVDHHANWDNAYGWGNHSGLYLPIGGGVLTGPLYFIDANTYISKDGSGDMTFTSAVAGTKTLTELDCPDAKKLLIVATGQSEGDIHLSDATNWNVNKARIFSITVKTSSTNFAVWILQNDNGYATDDAYEKARWVGGGDGTAWPNGLRLYFGDTYEDEDVTCEVHIYWQDLSGSNTADFTITGEKMR